jgi:hypothetical protein
VRRRPEPGPQRRVSFIAIIEVVVGKFIRLGAVELYPAYGQGAAGYAKRYGAGFADEASNRLFSGAIYPFSETSPEHSIREAEVAPNLVL